MRARDPPYSRAQRMALVISCLTECFASSRRSFESAAWGRPVESVYQARVMSSEGMSMILMAIQDSRYTVVSSSGSLVSIDRVKVPEDMRGEASPVKAMALRKPKGTRSSLQRKFGK